MLEIQKKLISMNYTKGVKIIPKYIVIHETDNEDVGANTLAHFNYWNTNVSAKSSTHFVVDDSNIIQLLELDSRAWHVGDNKEYSDITNDNTIGIEICVNSDGDYIKARQNAIELAQYLLKEFNFSIDKLKRHMDASGKHCPRKMIDNPDLWIDFVKKVQGNPEPLKVEPKIDSKILDIQKKLNQLKFLGSNGKTLVEDGILGANTKFAIKEFQYVFDLVIDGIVGEKTLDAMNHILVDRPTLKKDSKDNMSIRYLQWRLSIPFDGIFGNQTFKAVIMYQANHNLIADGIVGKNTWKSLLE